MYIQNVLLFHEASQVMEHKLGGVVCRIASSDNCIVCEHWGRPLPCSAFKKRLNSILSYATFVPFIF